MIQFKIKPRLIVAGSTGYIGRHIMQYADQKLKMMGGSAVAADRIFKFRLENPEEIDYEKINPLDVVLLLAAISSPDICAKEKDRCRAVNVTGTSTFISRVISRGARVIFFSSDTVYGERDDEFDETTGTKPAGDYAVMKHEVESRFLENESFKTARLSYVFSNEDKFTRYLTQCVGRNEVAEIFHPFHRAVIHRDDVVEAAVALALRWDDFSQPIFNFGGPEVISRVDMANTIRDIMMPGLRFRVVEPDEAFFLNRPRIINMRSASLPLLLGRLPRTLADAALLESKKEM